MKKYRVTSAHQLLKEGLIIEQMDNGNLMFWWNGFPQYVAQDLADNPTWYEEVKETKERLSWMLDFMKDNGDSNSYGGVIQLTEGERKELTNRVAALVNAYQEEITK